jgi:hypothetical protein
MLRHKVEVILRPLKVTIFGQIAKLQLYDRKFLEVPEHQLLVSGNKKSDGEPIAFTL